MKELTVKRKSFSQNIKDELLAKVVDREASRILLAFALMTTAKFKNQSVRYSLAYRPFVYALKNTLMDEFGIDAQLIEGKGISSIEITSEADVQTLRQWLTDQYLYEFARGRVGVDPASFNESNKRTVLRALFLSCGSLTEPSKAYHLEFSVHRISLAEFTQALLKEFDIRSGILKRYGYNVLYIKDADNISSVLGLMGAATGLLHFESGRVTKEVNNSVNRVVNCDSANARRIADSSARQMDLLDRLKQEKGFEFLPETLRETAETRLDNPGLSISELGAIQSQAIGKSGMYHRLKKLEQIAEEILCL